MVECLAFDNELTQSSQQAQGLLQWMIGYKCEVNFALAYYSRYSQVWSLTFLWLDKKSFCLEGEVTLDHLCQGCIRKRQNRSNCVSDSTWILLAVEVLHGIDGQKSQLQGLDRWSEPGHH